MILTMATQIRAVYVAALEHEKHIREVNRAQMEYLEAIWHENAVNAKKIHERELQMYADQLGYVKAEQKKMAAYHEQQLGLAQVQHQPQPETLTFNQPSAANGSNRQVGRYTAGSQFGLANKVIASFNNQLPIHQRRRFRSDPAGREQTQGTSYHILHWLRLTCTEPATRRVAWQTAIAQGLQNQLLPQFVGKDCITDEKVHAHVMGQFENEEMMCTTTAHLFAEFLDRPPTNDDPGVKVFNTRDEIVLNTSNPDLCICIGGSRVADLSLIAVAVKIKHKSHIINEDDYGETLEYLEAMKAKQPNRLGVVALLTNLHQNYIILLRVTNPDLTRLVLYKSATLAASLNYIKMIVLAHSTLRPSALPFPLELGIMERRLGNPQNHDIGEFKIDETTVVDIRNSWPDEVPFLGTTVAVKVRKVPIGELSPQPSPDGKQHEAMMYDIIQSCAPVCPQLAKLIYTHAPAHVLGVIPVGKPLDPNAITDHHTLHKLMLDVLMGITWLHNNGILHCAIQCDNVVIVSAPSGVQQARIIDFGSAITLSPDNIEFPVQSYSGDLICCPRELIGAVGKEYTPKRSHDLHAWVLMLNMCVFPGGFPYRQSKSDEIAARKLEAHWNRMALSRVWGPLVVAAQEGAVDALENELLQILILPDM